MARKKVEATPKTAWVVSRYNWRRHGDGWRQGAGEFRLTSFDSAELAEAERVRLEENARRRLNPFRCADELSGVTSYPETVFLDWVQDAGLSPPAAKKGKRDWAAWWDLGTPAAGADQRAKVWQACDKFRFYHVVERPAWPVGYVAVAPLWEPSAGNAIITEEGGEILSVYRTRQPAFDEARQQGFSDSGDRRWWFPSGCDPLDPETHWRQFLLHHPTCDVIEIDLEGIAAGRKTQPVWLVARRAWDFFDGFAWQERVPLRCFAAQPSAEACRRELEDDYRRRHDVWSNLGEWQSEDDSEAFFAAAARLGMPRRGNQDSSTWWQERGLGLSYEQRQTLWEGVSEESSVFSVIERELRD